MIGGQVFPVGGVFGEVDNQFFTQVNRCSQVDLGILFFVQGQVSIAQVHAGAGLLLAGMSVLRKFL